MSTASAEIAVSAEAALTRVTFNVTVKDRDGQPLAGEELDFAIEGDGSLQPRHDAKSLIRETRPNGTAEITWYRRSIFGRDVRATLRVSAKREDCSVELEEVVDATTGPSVSFIPRVFKPRSR